LDFRHDTMLKTRDEFVPLLEAARQNADPLDDLLSRILTSGERSPK